jgi:hypothetical protein
VINWIDTKKNWSPSFIGFVVDIKAENCLFSYFVKNFEFWLINTKFHKLKQEGKNWGKMFQKNGFLTFIHILRNEIDLNVK